MSISSKKHEFDIFIFIKVKFICKEPITAARYFNYSYLLYGLLICVRRRSKNVIFTDAVTSDWRTVV